MLTGLGVVLAWVFLREDVLYSNRIDVLAYAAVALIIFFFFILVEYSRKYNECKFVAILKDIRMLWKENRIEVIVEE